MSALFLPTTRAEMAARGWDALDVILVTGDAYIDSPFMGVAVIGRVLVHHGFRVGVIAQPDTDSAADLLRLGEPRLRPQQRLRAQPQVIDGGVVKLGLRQREQAGAQAGIGQARHGVA